MKTTYHGIPRETAIKWVQEATAPLSQDVEREVMYIHGFEIDKDRIRKVEMLDKDGVCDITVILNPPAAEPI